MSRKLVKASWNIIAYRRKYSSVVPVGYRTPKIRRLQALEQKSHNLFDRNPNKGLRPKWTIALKSDSCLPVPSHCLTLHSYLAFKGVHSSPHFQHGSHTRCGTCPVSWRRWRGCAATPSAPRSTSRPPASERRPGRGTARRVGGGLRSRRLRLHSERNRKCGAREGQTR